MKKVNYEYPAEEPSQEQGPRKGLDLRYSDDAPWGELYPGLPRVEEAQQDEDPILWMKTNDAGDGQYFYVAGFSADVVPHTIEFPSGESITLEPIHRRFFCMVVDHKDKEIGLMRGI